MFSRNKPSAYLQLGQNFTQTFYIVLSVLVYTEWKVLQPLMAVFKPQLSPECKARQEVKAKQWELHFAEYGRGVSIYRTTEIAKLVLQGIPDSLRREVWMTFSGQLGFKNTCCDQFG